MMQPQPFPTVTELWQAYCKAHQKAIKNQWREPYATKAKLALAAYEAASGGQFSATGYNRPDPDTQRPTGA